MFSGNKRSLERLAPKGVSSDSQDLARPSQQEIETTTQETKDALARLIAGKGSSTPATLAPSTQYLKYTNPDAPDTDPKLIKMVHQQTDPLAPPKFKAKKMPRRAGSPPAPVLHSPPRKVTKEEQASWKIPPCVSNWKNPKGFTISLDKRMLSDGKSLQPVCVNDNFAKLSEALYVADQYAREELDKRAALQRRQAEEERESKEEYLRTLARRAREERLHRDADRDRSDDLDKQLSSRISKHDVDEQRSRGNRPFTKEVQFDQRLFNQNAGIESGFANDEEYNLYDRPLFKGRADTYKPTDVATEPEVKRSGPIQFEKEASNLDDPFGVESFLSAARKGKLYQ